MPGSSKRDLTVHASVSLSLQRLMTEASCEHRQPPVCVWDMGEQQKGSCSRWRVLT